MRLFKNFFVLLFTYFQIWHDFCYIFYIVLETKSSGDDTNLFFRERNYDYGTYDR